MEMTLWIVPCGGVAALAILHHPGLPLREPQVLQEGEVDLHQGGGPHHKYGCDPDLIIADVVKIENSLFTSASVLLEEDRFPVLVETRDGKLQEVDSFSTLTSTGTPRTIFSPVCPEEYRGKVQGCAREILVGEIG